MNGERYVPTPTGVHAEFHAACLARAAVCVQRCADCGHRQHPPRWLCANCRSARYEFEPQSGAAVCRSAVVTHRATSPGWPVPYTTVVAELPTGPRLIAAWESAEPPTPGGPVTVVARPIEKRFAFFVAAPSRGNEGR
jgi:hypothetical protein